MPDHDPGPDPMDKAYAQAEAVLNDEAARAARRERVLAAVAGEAATSAEPSTPRPAWRRGGWLAAASVAGLAALLTVQVYRPAQTPPPAASRAADAEVAATPPPASEAAAQAPAPRPIPVAPRGAAPSTGDIPLAAPAPAPPPLPLSEAAPPPPPAQVAREADAARAGAQAPRDVVATAKRREENLQERPERRADHLSEVVVTAQKVKPAPAPDFVVSPRAAARDAAKLHAAAAAGRTGDLSALLDQGVPIDAPDAEGETALMKSIQADKPAAAALLRRRGANLDRRNNDGDSARDMAAALEDAEIDKALGLEP
jgi:type IV secretory pathway VirB10-like protein